MISDMLDRFEKEMARLKADSGDVTGRIKFNRSNDYHCTNAIKRDGQMIVPDKVESDSWLGNSIQEPPRLK